MPLINDVKKQDKGSKEKIQALSITDSLDLRPLSVFDGQGYEENALIWMERCFLDKVM
jgi:hypothetical protein